MTAIANFTTSIPLDRIEMSQNNIRKGETDPDPELMASLLADGQLQNIGVSPHETKADTYVVVYGFRRLRAFRALAKAKDIARDAPILCMVVDGEASEQTARALSENICRKAMNPVDEYEAYAKLAKQGLDPEAIAKRQGVTVRKVRDRLALGQAAACVRAALRDEAITLDTAVAYASCPDLRRQERVFKELGRSHPTYVRRALRAVGISSEDAIGRLIDVDLYEQSGGRLERDLIDTHVTFLDEDIVFALRDQVLQAHVSTLSSDGWKWVEAYASHADLPMTGLDRVYPEPADLTETEEATLAQLEDERAALEASVETDDEGGEETEWSDEQYDRYEEILSGIRDLRTKTAFTDDQKARAGCFVYVGRDGISVQGGLVRPEDREPVAGQTPSSGTGVPGPLQDAVSAQDNASKAQSGPSASLLSDFAALRTQVVGQLFIEDPGLALAYTQFTTALQATGTYTFGWSVLGTKIEASPHAYDRIRLNKGETSDTRAGRRLAAARRELPLGFLSEPTLDTAWAAFLSLGDDQRAAIHAWFIADQLTSYSGTDRTLPDVIGEASGIDLRDYVELSADVYLSRPRKAELQSLILELAGAHGARLIEAHGSTKAALVEIADDLFRGQTPVEPDVRARLDAFLPEGLGFDTHPAKSVEGGPDGSDDDSDAKEAQDMADSEDVVDTEMSGPTETPATVDSPTGT